MQLFVLRSGSFKGIGKRGLNGIAIPWNSLNGDILDDINSKKKPWKIFGYIFFQEAHRLFNPHRIQPGFLWIVFFRVTLGQVARLSLLASCSFVKLLYGF